MNQMNKITMHFVGQPPPPTTGNRSMVKVGQTELTFGWKDGQVATIESNAAVSKMHVERSLSGPGDPQGEILCWDCYEDTVSGGWVCYRRLCVPTTMDA